MYPGIKLPALAMALALIMAAPAARAAATPAHDHAHGAGADALQLDAGKKWASDEPLRIGMERIRDAVEAALPGAHRGSLKPAQYAALGQTVETEVAGIVRQCKLEPRADAALHVIIAQLMEAADIAQGKDAHARRRDGVVKMAQALDRYHATFEHPGWRSPAAHH